MRVVSLGSGSCGNAYLVGEGGAWLMIDCGVRYMKSRNGRSVYAIELAPDGKPPRCPALEANGLKLAKSLKPLPGMPAAHVFE